MAIGGYTTAILMAGNEEFGGPLSGGMKDVWTLPIAGLVAGLFGLAFGLPALRLSGLYLALATFAIAVAMPSTVKRFEEFTGGGSGIQLFGTPELTGSIKNVEVFGWSLSPNDWMYYLAWSIALVAFAVAWLILRGRTGRAFRAVRDSETAAVSSGVSLARYKTLAFGVRALDLPPRRHSRRRPRRPVGARLRGYLHHLLAALGAGPGPRIALAGSDHRGDAEAGRPGNRLRHRADPPHVRDPERSRRFVSTSWTADLASPLLSFRVMHCTLEGGAE
jgi:hypothetical protein